MTDNSERGSAESATVRAGDERSIGSAGRSSPALSLDHLLDLLAREQRRCVLYYLDGTGAATVDDLVEHVATASGVAETNVDVALRHTHLPRLADAGVVDYDPDSGRVALAAAADRLRPYLELTVREDRSDA